MEVVFKFFKKNSHMNWALADQAMVSGVNFFTGLLLARFLGIDEFGKFTLIWMSVLVVNSIQMAMISSPMMSIGPKQEKNAEKIYYRAVILQQLIFSIITFSLLFIGMYLAGLYKTEWQITELALPLALAGAAFQFQDFLRRYFFCRQQAYNAFFNDAISYLGQLGILVWLFFTIEIAISQVLWIIALTSLLAILFGLTQVDTKPPTLENFNAVTKRHWLFSKWLTLMALLQWISGNLIYIIAGSVLGSASVGVLKSCQNIMACCHVLFHAMENFVPSKASKIYMDSGLKNLRGYKNKIVYIGGSLTSLFALLVAVFAKNILLFVYGEAFTDYSYVLQWFSIIYIFMFLALPYRAALRAIENTKSIFMSQIFASIFVICFGWVLVHYFALNGVLFTFLLVYIIVLLYLHISFSYKTPVLMVKLE